MWLAATNSFLYAEVFREYDITGAELRRMTDMSLSRMNIADSTHKQSLLLAAQELFTGQSETVSIGCFPFKNYSSSTFSVVPGRNPAQDPIGFNRILSKIL